MLARVLSLCAVLLLAICALDWVIDLSMDNPRFLRAVLLVGWGLTLAAGVFFVLRAMVIDKTDDDLALWIEAKTGGLENRLISAVQLNRDAQKTKGMSGDLIAAVTQQAENVAETVDLDTVCEKSRYRWSATLLTPILLVMAVMAVWQPATVLALLSRMFMGNDEIPRAVQFERFEDAIWPANEENTLRLSVTGASESAVGWVTIYPVVGRSFRVSLEREKGTKFVAKVPAAESDFQFTARLGDGRLRTMGNVRYTPRPSVQQLQATVLLPEAILGKRADGTLYEESLRGGDIAFRLELSKARVEISTQVPIVEAELEVISGKKSRKVRSRLQQEKDSTTIEFPLQPGDTNYLVRVVDQYGFASLAPARRVIRQLPIDPPDVAFEPENFAGKGEKSISEESEVEGIPILLGERFRLEYRAAHRYGLANAWVRFRVIPRSEGPDKDSGQIDRESFKKLPLGPVKGEKTPSAAALAEFKREPAKGGEEIPWTSAVGLYNFDTKGISDDKGGRLTLQEGDRIQFYVEVFSVAKPDSQPGRSAIREKEIVSSVEFLAWLQRKEDLKEKTRALEEQQRGARKE
jgi:hypothetical protein